MCESLALASVVVSRSSGEHRGCCPTDKSVVEVRLQGAGSMSIYKVQGRHVCDGDVITGNADDRA